MSNGSDLQAKFTFWTVILGMGALLLMFCLTLYVFKDKGNPAESIVAVMGAFTGVLGSLVGYVAGQAGKEKAEQRASQAQRQLTAVVGQGEKDLLERAKTAYPDWFK